MVAIVKILMSGVLIWLVTEFGKKSGKLGGLILSLPVTSIIALTWLWFETKDSAKVASVSKETLVFILPSLVFFVLLWLLLERGVNFYVTLASSIVVTALSYALFFNLRGDA